MAAVDDVLGPFDAAVRDAGFVRKGRAWERRLADVTWRIVIDRGSRDTSVFNLDPWVLVHRAEQEWKDAGLSDGPASLRYIDEHAAGRGFPRWRKVAGPADEGLFAEFQRDVLPWFEGLQTDADVLAACQRATRWQPVLLGAALAKHVGDEAALADLLSRVEPSWEDSAAAPYLRHLRGQAAAVVAGDQADLLRWYEDHRKALSRKGFRAPRLEARVLPGADAAHVRAAVFPQDSGFSWPDGVEELEVAYERKTAMTYLTLGFYSRNDRIVVDAAAALDALADLVATDEVRGRPVHRVAAADVGEAVKRLRTVPRRPPSAEP